VLLSARRRIHEGTVRQKKWMWHWLHHNRSNSKPAAAAMTTPPFEQSTALKHKAAMETVIGQLPGR
jgi:hypothetical protein